MYLVRHLIAILILPFTAVVLVPWLLLQGGPALLDRIATTGIVWTVVGAAVFLVGLCGFAWCVLLFGSVGHGTLAPWDPTQDLVAQGPYRYTRNPMISSVAAMLGGEALLFESSSLAVWLVVFIAVNQAYFLALEEPGLEKRFGKAYLNYKTAVPRWIPRWPR